MTANAINELFEKFNSLTALIVGDVMIDAYYWGKVERISPEAPVPIVQVQQRENRLGGAANVALNVKMLGAKAIIASVVGDGSKGDIFRSTLKENGFTTEGIIDSPERMTTVKTRVISQGHHLLRIDEEHTNPLSSTDERHLLDCIRAILERQKIDVIIINFLPLLRSTQSTSTFCIRLPPPSTQLGTYILHNIIIQFIRAC